ncbi:helix-turn-helix transcriptional regulator [uncultured Mailhella sp.]|uniref:helix-turn-helix domain-containing protein n=1 Tax=uncultured Mailhella sp. TaxID=1981031 RepID=UPI0025FD8040|nr:helix-turn-helix transcriptional regulator [uncultured Mailhella sp.]
MKKKSDAFGPVLRRIRLEKHLTQEELSERLGVAAPYVSMLESGHKYPNLEMFFRIAEALDVRPACIMEDMEERIRRSI